MSGGFGVYFYHRTTRKIIASLMAMFSDIQIARYTLDGSNEKDRLTVPLILGQKEKYVYRNTEDPDLTNPKQKTLPIMSLEWKGLKYNAARKQQSIQMVKNINSTEGSIKQLMGVPYDLSFTLSVLVRNIEDGIQIIEQVIPNFTPEYTLQILIDDVMNISKQFPVKLDSVEYTVENEGPAENMRLVMWTLSLTVSAQYYPMTTDPAIIKTAITNIYDNTENKNILTYLNLQANGNGNFQDIETVFQGADLPTANASASVIKWDTKNRKLYVGDITGTFLGNTIVVGANTNAQWNVSTIVPADVSSAQITVTPNPFSANATDPYTYTTVINEYLGP